MSILVIRGPHCPLFEIDDDGQVVYMAPGLHWEIKNSIPERIQSAAAGGTTLEMLAGQTPGVMFCGDVHLDEVSLVNSWLDGRVTRLVMSVEDDEDLDTLIGVDVSRIGEELEKRGSTLRAVIFEADQVHLEGEPEPETVMTEDQIGDLVGSEFFDQCRARRLIGTHIDLKATFGARWWGEVDPAALYLWAADHGVADYLPESIRRASHHEELGR